MDKLTLLFAAVQHLAEESGHTKLAEYLGHTSHHSSVFQEEIQQHYDNINNLEEFKAKSEEETHPGAPAQTYSQAQLDAIVAAAIKKAKAA
jgi:hypothetical protein